VKTIWDCEDQLIQQVNEYKQLVLHKPYKHICIDNLLPADLLRRAVAEFPDLEKLPRHLAHRMYGPTDAKYASNFMPFALSHSLREVISFFQGSAFVSFVQKIFEIEQPLLSDPMLLGGGLHQIARGGFLKIHTDFNKHPVTKLDRRINALLYLNEYWHESYGGQIELWNDAMDKANHAEYLPLFNRIIIFPTNDYTPHGHPNPLSCPDLMKRRSLAFYYYSNGRPESELKANDDHSTIYKERPGEQFN